METNVHFASFKPRCCTMQDNEQLKEHCIHNTMLNFTERKSVKELKTFV